MTVSGQTENSHCPRCQSHLPSTPRGPCPGPAKGSKGIPKGMDGPQQTLPMGTQTHLLLLLPRQLHLLLLLLEEHRSHVFLLRVRRQQLVPQRGQLVDHDQ